MDENALEILCAYQIVGPGGKRSEVPLITYEHSTQTVELTTGEIFLEYFPRANTVSDRTHAFGPAVRFKAKKIFPGDPAPRVGGSDIWTFQLPEDDFVIYAICPPTLGRLYRGRDTLIRREWLIEFTYVRYQPDELVEREPEIAHAVGLSVTLARSEDGTPSALIQQQSEEDQPSVSSQEKTSQGTRQKAETLERYRRMAKFYLVDDIPQTEIARMFSRSVRDVGRAVALAKKEKWFDEEVVED